MFKNLRIEALSWLLFWANSEPWHKESFYPIKDYLLNKYGIFVGVDVQRIKKECYTCDGTGIYRPRKMYCWSCGGDGIYQSFWVVLNRYQIGQFTFHLPKKRTFGKPQITEQADNIIKGYIKHNPPKYNLNLEAYYWLLLIYRPLYFFKHLGRCCPLKDKRTPMVIFNAMIYKWKWYYNPITIGKRLWRNLYYKYFVERKIDFDDLPF